ncbi:hypothetical protein GCM10015535_11350 [Streptomyces gelaticus]|uniref:Uncharacterized protein n=1 Tax=Streptomyces gelaticus TaxID=285446 RepID=A0ABQ2VTT5_9ACTN|nr:hypothetical protein GCM10015535_11350 [Streptomyces gelaticus]
MAVPGSGGSCRWSQAGRRPFRVAVSVHRCVSVRAGGPDCVRPDRVPPWRREVRATPGRPKDVRRVTYGNALED